MPVKSSRKPSLTIVVENKIGGVQFYYTNLARAGAFDAFDVRYVAIESDDRDAKLTVALEGAPTEIFRHRHRENRYTAFRRLAQHFAKQPGLVLTNWGFELECLDSYRRPDLTVAHVCHDEYYVQVALQNAGIIDIFIAHNPYFADRLKAQLPADRAADVYFLPFGIRQDPRVRRVPNPDRPLRVVYIGRLHRVKGALELPAVDDYLRALGVQVEWNILGCGPEQENLERAVAGRGNFTITSPSDGPEMLRQAATGDVFLLPSRLDGTPLALMEAMSVGLVPVVSEFNPGVHWMVPPEVGFVCPIEASAMAAILAKLDANRPELEARSEATLARARAEFRVEDKAHAYSKLCERWQELKRPGSAPRKHYGYRLDQRWIPNAVVVGVRRVLEWARSIRDRR